MTLLDGLIKTCLLPAFSALFYELEKDKRMRKYDVVETVV